MKKLCTVFLVAAVLLSDIMCAWVAYSYRDMLCGIAHSCCSAPASVAFLCAVPFLLGIAICLIAAYVLHKTSCAEAHHEIRQK